MSLSCTLFLAVLGAAAAYEVCSGKDTGCATGEIEDMGLLQFRTEQSGPIPECQNLSTNASAPSKCPTGTIVNPSLWCISNPSCPGTTGCVEGTGCQYVPAPAPALLQQSGPIPECQNLSTNASNASKCPTGTIVNSGLWCISNPSCPGITGCVEGTGCQYVPAPAPALLQQSGFGKAKDAFGDAKDAVSGWFREGAGDGRAVRGRARARGRRRREGRRLRLVSVCGLSPRTYLGSRVVSSQPGQPEWRPPAGATAEDPDVFHAMNPSLYTDLSMAQPYAQH
jgi:hypothetical protein